MFFINILKKNIMLIKIDIVSNLYVVFIYILNKNIFVMYIFEYFILFLGFFGVFFFEKCVIGCIGFL